MKWMLFGPETYIFLAAFFFLILSMWRKPNPARDHMYALVLSALGVAVSLACVGAEGFLFSGTYRLDLFSQVFKVALASGLFLIVCLCASLEEIKKRYRQEFYFFLFVCTLAMMLLVSAQHLLTILLALELSSYSLYLLVTLRRNEDMGLEAGIKYFLTGIFASSIMIFGMALLYGATQAVYLQDLAQVMPELMSSPAAVIGMLLIFAGFFFKLAVYPFHIWVADTYQGAPDQVTAYIATASKVAVIAIVLRVISAVDQNSAYLVHVLAVLSITSMTLGNLAAITQKDMKRLLGYSTIAHSGYVLIGILSVGTAGYASAVFYALALLVMKFTVFLVVVVVSPRGRNLEIEELAGLHRRSPLLALALMVSVFSLAGIPPTVGFAGKFFVFMAAMDKGLFVLVLIAMVNVVVSLYYYLLVIKAAYLNVPRETLPPVHLSHPMRCLTGSLIATMVVVGFYPTPLIQLSEAMARSLM